MSYISDKSVQQIYDTIKVEEVVGDFVHLKRRGINHIGLCPFHHEKTPSFNVSAAKGIFKCFGCGEGGDAVQFVMKILEKFENCFSMRDRSWDVFHAIYCENVDIAKKIEQHIKNMKSRKYIHNLKEFPEIEVKLIDMYSS